MTHKNQKRTYKRRYKQGWYILSNPSKFMKPLDEFMQSYKDGKVNFKSSLEERAFMYQDLSPSVKQWSAEPFAIPYVKPSTSRTHRYFIDMFIVTKEGRFLIEIKPKSQTLPPVPPKNSSQKSARNHQKELQTFSTNQAKWKQAQQFQSRNNQEFVIFTEDLLPPLP